MRKPILDDTGRTILRAFESKAGRSWRTVGGISREVGLPSETVSNYLASHNEYFVRSPQDLAGIPLYAPTQLAMRH